MGGWGAKFESIMTSFQGGVRTSARGDLIPSDTAPMALNASWENIGDNTAIAAKRKGCEMLNTGTAIDAALVGQLFYDKRSGTSGSYTTTHVLVAEDGDLHALATDGSVTNYTSGEFSTSLTGAFVASIEAQNYAYFVAGVACTAGGVTGTMLRFDGSTWYVAGMAAPDAPTASDTGTGDMTGTYEWALTYRNSNTGYESSRSGTVSTTPSSEQTQVSWDAPTDAQVTHVNVYVRKSTISTGFYRATSIAVGTTTVTLNISDSAYNALTILAPDEDENDPPPSGVKYLAWHKSRLFAATDTEVYYTKVELPEAFDPEKYEPVNPDDGQKITAIKSVFDKLVVLKDRSMYVLVGNGPNDWFVEQVSQDVGCVAPGSVVYAGGRLYWWSTDGPVVWDGVSDPQHLGKALVESLVDPFSLNTSKLSQIAAVVDSRQSRVLWAVPALNQERNNQIISFKYQLGQFEGLWYAVDVASFTTGTDANELEWVYIGGYGGRVFKWWTGKKDGVPPGAQYTGTFAATSTAHGVITTSGLDTTTGYKDLFVTVVNPSDGAIMGRRRISTSTSTTLTLENDVAGLTSGTTYRYYIGNIDFQFDSKWQDDSGAFYKKRFEFIYIETQVDTETEVYLDFATDYGANAEGSREITLNATIANNSGGAWLALWDQAIWDAATWAESSPEAHRVRAAKTGRNWRVRVTHTDPDAEFKLLKLGVRGEYLTDKF